MKFVGVKNSYKFDGFTKYKLCCKLDATKYHFFHHNYSSATIFRKLKYIATCIEDDFSYLFHYFVTIKNAKGRN